MYTFFRSKPSASFAQMIQAFTLKRELYSLLKRTFIFTNIIKKLPDVGSLS
jgi:hypothetical protein